jgi:hypothetical protein
MTLETDGPPHFGFNDPDPELEFRIITFAFSVELFLADDLVGQQIKTLLNDGWQIDDKIISPPFVMLIFSREKEIQDNV